MTAPTKPLPPHGTPERYRKGCRKDCCRRAENRRKKRAQLVGPLTIDTTRVVEHVRLLLANGASRQSIADAAGCGLDTVKRAVNGQHARIRASTAARILAVTHAPERETPTDAVGSIRRVRALMAVGYSSEQIQTASGVNRKTVANLLNGSATGVWVHTAESIKQCYAALSEGAGTSARSRNRAARLGWANPAAWHSISMDDPDAFPDVTGHCGTLKGHRIHETRNIPFCRPCRDAKARDSQARRASRAAQRLKVAA